MIHAALPAGSSSTVQTSLLKESQELIASFLDRQQLHKAVIWNQIDLVIWDSTYYNSTRFGLCIYDYTVLPFILVLNKME